MDLLLSSFGRIEMYFLKSQKYLNNKKKKPANSTTATAGFLLDTGGS